MDAKWSKSSQAAYSIFLVPISISVERQPMQLLASPEQVNYTTQYGRNVIFHLRRWATIETALGENIMSVDQSILNQFPWNFAKPFSIRILTGVKNSFNIYV